MTNVKKLNFADFETMNLKQCDLNSVQGGECTGGGFTMIGPGRYVIWDADETDGCTTYYTNARIENNCE